MSGNNGPLSMFGDFGFVGGHDPAPNPLQDVQLCINWYPEVDQQNPKEVVGLLGAPGLAQLCAAPGGGAPGFSPNMTEWPRPYSGAKLPVRGAWELPGGEKALAVIGSTCYLVSLNTVATPSSFPSLSLVPVGTLLTSSGPVSIRDNNAGGYAVIVDGSNGYLYQINGPAPAKFGGSVTSGSQVIQLGAQVPIGIAVGMGLSAASGAFPLGTTLLSIDFNAGTVTASQPATLTAASDTITGTLSPFSRIIDPGFLGADTVSYIDGWWVFNRPGTQTFYTNSQPYALNFNPTYYGLKDAASDNLMAVFENKEELWLLGERTTEIWYDAGGSYFPFSRLVGTLLQSGCKAKHSVARFYTDGQEGLIWFGRSERGENVIIRTQGFIDQVISSVAFGDEVATYPITSDAIGYTYQEDTHEFYVLTFPSADTTWVYDQQSGLLHKRLSYDPYAQAWHRHRSNCFMNFQGMRIVGDYECGALYWLTRTAYTDAGWPLLAKRRSPHVWDKGQRGRVFAQSLQLDFLPGVGNARGMGADPQAKLRISRDGGITFGQAWPAPLGKIGERETRTMWRRLGNARDLVFDVEVIDPVRRDLIGCTLKAFSSA